MIVYSSRVVAASILWPQTAFVCTFHRRLYICSCKSGRHFCNGRINFAATKPASHFCSCKSAMSEEVANATYSDKAFRGRVFSFLQQQSCLSLQNLFATGPLSSVVSASDCGSELGHWFESHQSYGIFQPLLAPTQRWEFYGPSR